MLRHLVSLWKRDESPQGSDQDQDPEEVSDEEEYISSGGYDEGAFLSPTSQLVEVIDEEFPISVVKFFKLFWSEESPFLAYYHSKRGDSDVQIEKWTHHPQFATTRLVVYRSPMNCAVGSKFTMIDETQRYYLQKDHLVVEMVSVQKDVEDGECFRVEERWDVTSVQSQNSKDARCRLILKSALNFFSAHSNTGVTEDALNTSKQSYKLWVELAKEEIKRKALSNSKPSSQNDDNNNNNDDSLSLATETSANTVETGVERSIQNPTVNTTTAQPNNKAEIVRMMIFSFFLILLVFLSGWLFLKLSVLTEKITQLEKAMLLVKTPPHS